MKNTIVPFLILIVAMWAAMHIRSQQKEIATNNMAHAEEVANLRQVIGMKDGTISDLRQQQDRCLHTHVPRSLCDARLPSNLQNNDVNRYFNRWLTCERALTQCDVDCVLTH